MSVDGVVLEVVREGFDEELVAHTAMVHVMVRCNLSNTPVCEIGGSVVLIELVHIKKKSTAINLPQCRNDHRGPKSQHHSK